MKPCRCGMCGRCVRGLVARVQWETRLNYHGEKSLERMVDDEIERVIDATLESLRTQTWREAIEAAAQRAEEGWYRVLATEIRALPIPPRSGHGE